MKRKYILLIMPFIMATGCSPKGGNNYANYKNWIYLAPQGAPAIALSYFSGYKNFQTNSDPTNIVAMMKAGKADIVALPTNIGIQAIRQGNLPYKLGFAITFGNIYIASTGHDDDQVMDENDYIVSFQQGAVPDKMFHYVYGDDYNSALHYVSSAQEAAKCLKLGKNLADDNKNVDYVVLAEPALTSVLETTPNAKEYADLQELYIVKTGGSSFYQASIFVKKDLDIQTVMEPIYGNIYVSISNMIEDPNKAVEYMNQNSAPEATFGVKPEIAKKMFENGNRMNINAKFFYREEEMNDLSSFLSIFNLDPIESNEIY